MPRPLCDDVEDGGRRILRVAVHEPADQRGHVQHVHAAHVAREVGLGRERVDPRQLGIERLTAERVYAGLVHEAGEEVAELLAIRAGRLVGGFRGPFGDGAQPFLGLVDRFVEPAVGAAVGRDLGFLQPAAVDVLVEVVLRPHGLVEPGDVDPGGQWFGGGAGAAAGAGGVASREHDTVRLAAQASSSNLFIANRSKKCAPISGASPHHSVPADSRNLALH